MQTYNLVGRGDELRSNLLERPNPSIPRVFFAGSVDGDLSHETGV